MFAKFSDGFVSSNIKESKIEIFEDLSNNFSVKNLKFLVGKLITNDEELSLIIPIEKFRVNNETIDTKIILDGIHFEDDWPELVGRTFYFPINPHNGYIDASIYLNNVHNPIDVHEISIVKVIESKVELEIDVFFDFEYELSGFKNEKHKIKVFANY